MSTGIRELTEGAYWREENILEWIYHIQGSSSRMKRKGYDVRDIMDSPGWCGSVDLVLACKPKGHSFDSWSGHMPGV